MDNAALVLERLSTDGTVKTVRQDHIERYQWATTRAHGHILDAGCGSGYGSWILAGNGFSVTAIDSFADGVAFARERYDRPGINWIVGDLETDEMTAADTVVTFEVIEHLAQPDLFLKWAPGTTLLASVPNQDVWPWSQRVAHTHYRHYRKHELDALLRYCGWEVSAWFGQRDGHSPVEPDVQGRTLVVEARRA